MADETENDGQPKKYHVTTLGDLMNALRKLAGEHGTDLKVGFSFNGKVAAVTEVQQWSVYVGPLCQPGVPPQPIKYIHLFSKDWI